MCYVDQSVERHSALVEEMQKTFKAARDSVALFRKGLALAMLFLYKISPSFISDLDNNYTERADRLQAMLSSYVERQFVEMEAELENVKAIEVDNAARREKLAKVKDIAKKICSAKM